MSVRIALRELQEQLPDVLDRAAKGGEEFIIERNGKDCAVLVSAQSWRRRKLGKQLDGLGPGFRLSAAKQARAEELLAAKGRRFLTRAEQREMTALLRESDEVLLRRANAIGPSG